MPIENPRKMSFDQKVQKSKEHLDTTKRAGEGFESYYRQSDALVEKAEAELETEYAYLTGAQTNSEARKSARRKEFSQISAQAKRSALILIIIAVWVAIVVDIISIWDLGFLLSWLHWILLHQFIIKRTAKMTEASKTLVDKTEKTVTEIKRLHTELHASGKYSGAMPAFLATVALPRISSYMSKFVKEAIAVQIAELIPAVSALPLYIGQLVKALIQQAPIYAQNKMLVKQYDLTLKTLESLEQIKSELASNSTFEKVEMLENVVSQAQQRAGQQRNQEEEILTRQSDQQAMVAT